MCIGSQHSYTFVFLRSHKASREQTPPPCLSAAELTFKAENDALKVEKQKTDTQIGSLATELAASQSLVAIKDDQIKTNLAQISSQDIQIKDQAKTLEALKLENNKQQNEINDLRALNIAGQAREKVAAAQMSSLSSELAQQKALMEAKDNEIKVHATHIAKQLETFEAFKLTSKKNETDLRQTIEAQKKEHASELACMQVAAEKLKEQAFQAEQKACAQIMDLNAEVAAKTVELQVQTGLVNEFKDAIQRLQMKTDTQELQILQLSLEMQKMKEKEQRVLAILTLFEHSNSANLVNLIKQELS